MIEYRTGDLFAQDDVDAIGHGVNCRGVMGGGIAKLFKRKYPAMYTQYNFACRAGLLHAGDVFPWVEYGDPPNYIFNIASQTNPGADATLGALERGVHRVFDLCETLRLKSFAIPRIGAGIGGLEWSEVKARLEGLDEYMEGRMLGDKPKLIVVTLPGEES